MSRYFNQLVIGGNQINLAHLDPFTLTFHSERIGKVLRVAITFTNHCFSAEFGTIPHPAGQPVIWDGKKRRTFCTTRYQLSHDLPDLIRQLPEKTVTLASHGTTWVHTVTIQNPQGPYHAFLTVSRATGHERTWQDINVMVESAYPQTQQPPALKGLPRPFALVCADIYGGNAAKPKKKRR